MLLFLHCTAPSQAKYKPVLLSRPVDRETRATYFFVSFRFSSAALVLFARLKRTASNQRGGRQPCMSPVEACQAHHVHLLLLLTLSSLASRRALLLLSCELGRRGACCLLGGRDGEMQLAETLQASRTTCTQIKTWARSKAQLYHLPHSQAHTSLSGVTPNQGGVQR